MPSLPEGLLFVSKFIDFMISSKDISASQRLEGSLDFFFLLGILLTNSVVAAVELCLVQSFSQVFLQIEECPSDC